MATISKMATMDSKFILIMMMMHNITLFGHLYIAIENCGRYLGELFAHGIQSFSPLTDFGKLYLSSTKSDLQCPEQPDQPKHTIQSWMDDYADLLSSLTLRSNFRLVESGHCVGHRHPKPFKSINMTREAAVCVEMCQARLSYQEIV